MDDIEPAYLNIQRSKDTTSKEYEENVNKQSFYQPNLKQEFSLSKREELV
jgi:hypothetical protein